ncbi:MAG: haloacid dehalogenase-like hydrolase [Bacteroidales bacterium]|jgi:2-hydroxy-3-keto-5-methylthiopentenyl-1-phosphate phosphatase|nr:haloacid dehalogenase-like hydrolase [Bacteroidales bacterium]
MFTACKRTIAIAYDFDGTLSPGNMQDKNFIPDLEMDTLAFWQEANALAKDHDMDEILAYLHLMLSKAKEKNIPVKESSFMDYGRKITFFPGVEDYFKRINDYAKGKNLKIEHYIISSGLREMIKGTAIAKEFKNIFASGYQYDSRGEACWPALAVNYTNKTQFLFRINKGIDNSYDNTLINKIIPESEKPVPFSNMIYIGDGETDIPAMKMVNMQGGYSIAVYPPTSSDCSEPLILSSKFTEILQNDRANYIVPADYHAGAPLDRLLMNMIDLIAAKQNLLQIQLDVFGQSRC